MHFTVVRKAEPPHIERLGIVVVVGLNSERAADLTLTGPQVAIAHSFADGVASLELVRALELLHLRGKTPALSALFPVVSHWIECAVVVATLAVVLLHVAFRAFLALVEVAVSHLLVLVEVG
jgi:hypothetical protein